MSAIKCCGARWDSRIEICPRCQKRLEGTSPAGPPSESGCGDAERRNDQATPNIPHGSAVVEAKDGVKLRRLLDLLLEEAERLGQCSLFYRVSEKKVAALFAESAGQLSYMATELTRFLGEPRTQSGEDEVEECCCDGDKGRNYKDGDPFCMACDKPIARRKRKERSGLHNA